MRRVKKDAIVKNRIAKRNIVNVMPTDSIVMKHANASNAKTY